LIKKQPEEQFHAVRFAPNYDIIKTDVLVQ